MAYGKHGSLVVGQEFCEQVKRFHVQVIGGFVKHEHVTRVAKKACEQQAVAFSTAQGTNRATGAICREKEVLQIT